MQATDPRLLTANRAVKGSLAFGFATSNRALLPLPTLQEEARPDPNAVVQPHPGIQRTVSKPEDVTYMCVLWVCRG